MVAFSQNFQLCNLEALTCNFYVEMELCINEVYSLVLTIHKIVPTVTCLIFNSLITGDENS